MSRAVPPVVNVSVGLARLTRLGGTLAVLWGLSTASAAAGQAATSADVSRGRAIFETKCAGCHTIGGGVSVGPDLRGATAREPRDWLEALVADPAALAARKEPRFERLLASYHGVVMPDLGLSREDVRRVLDYVAAASERAEGKAPPAPVRTAEAATPGDPDRGKALFWGKIAFEKSGPACMACHDTAGGDPLGGGSLGPGLTRVFSKYGTSGLENVLSAMPFPVMTPLFRDRPLSGGERSDLAAYLERIAGLEPRAVSPAPIVLGAAGFFFLLAVILASTRFRLRDVRRSLARHARGGGGRLS